MIAVNQIFPLREIEEFTISPERQLRQGDGRVQAARAGRQHGATPRHRRAHRQQHDLHPQPTERPRPRDPQPARGVAARGSGPAHGATGRTTSIAPLVWDVDKAAYTPATLVRHIIEEATGISQDFFGTQWWRDPTGWTLVELAGPISGGHGRLFRDVLVPLARSRACAPPRMDPHVHPPGAELHHAALTHQRDALRAELRGRRAPAVGLLHRPRLARRQAPRSST